MKSIESKIFLIYDYKVKKRIWKKYSKKVIINLNLKEEKIWQNKTKN